ncbi:MAG: TonB-dependent receptor [Bacteroidetes bacterium]|nr:TonB-dependent receptor [Bacteroidota bacterium]
MRTYFLLMSFVFANLIVNAQHGGYGGQGQWQQGAHSDMTKITGVVTDNAGNPLPYASVALYKEHDSTLVKGVASDEFGNFSIPARPGKYYLKVTFLAYELKTISDIQVRDADVVLDGIKLAAGNKELQEVEVEVETPQMILKLDKRIYMVSKDPSNKGSNAAEILDELPSVTVDVEGNVSLRGSGNVRILIDGKPSGLTGISTSDALRQLQGDMIEKIEIITNPSARYDAEGEVGIINIILKKEKREGINGVFSANAGYPTNYGGSFSINYRKKFFNIFSSYGIGYREMQGGGSSDQEFFYADTTFSFLRDRSHTRGGLSNNFRLGSEFDLNDKNTLTISGMYSMSNGENNTLLIYSDYDKDDVLVQKVDRTELNDSERSNSMVNMMYRRSYKKKEKSWTVDMRYNQSSSMGDADLLEVSDDGSVPDVVQRSMNNQLQGNLLFQTDFILPFKKEGKLEMGLKSTFKTTDHEYKVEEQAGDTSWSVVQGLDNHLLYSENIMAAYLMAGNKHGKLSYQGGIRAEYSDISTDFQTTGELYERDYLDFFPSLHLSYELKRKHYLQLSYSKRITRPHFWYMSPFFGFSDSRNLFSGNPNLDPSYTDAVEFGHLKNWKNSSILSSIYYRYTSGVINWVFLPDSNGFTRIFPTNIGFDNSLGLELGGSWQPYKWWSLNANTNFYRSIIYAKYKGFDLSRDTYAWHGRLSSKWTIKKKTSFQASVNYRSPMISPQGLNFARYHINSSIARDVLKGKGTITFSVRDLLNTNSHGYIVKGEYFRTEGNFQWHSRTFRLNFSYRLNQQKRRGGNGGGNYEGGADMIGM